MVCACVCACVPVCCWWGGGGVLPVYHQYGRYCYIGMARVPHMRNTNMHRKISAKTEHLVVKGCYYHYSAVSLSNKPKNLTRNHR